MKLAATLQQQASARDLMRQRVLESVLKIRKQPGLIKELGRLEAPEATTQCFVREVGNRLEQGEWHILADDGGQLQ